MSTNLEFINFFVYELYIFNLMTPMLLHQSNQSIHQRLHPEQPLQEALQIGALQFEQVQELQYVLSSGLLVKPSEGLMLMLFCHCKK